jgi:hypothetical protein
MSNKSYSLVRERPVAVFYYAGTHSHPVRRTVLLVENTPNFLRGYELREGSIVRNFRQAPVKSYRKNRIATMKQLGPCKHRKPGKNVSSLKRMKAVDLLRNGV